VKLRVDSRTNPISANSRRGPPRTLAAPEQRQAGIKGLLPGATVISCGSVLAILGFLAYFALPIFSAGHIAEILS